jgi:WhiB family transcriptional regulator, redox-sensing transcriptional regulator
MTTPAASGASPVPSPAGPPPRRMRSPGVTGRLPAPGPPSVPDRSLTAATCGMSPWRPMTGLETSGFEVRHEPDVGPVPARDAGQVQPANGPTGSAASAASAANHLAVAGPPGTLLLGPDLPCRQDPDLFFAESPLEVNQAKALCRGCRARTTCLTKALERREPWGVWGGELLMRGAIVPHKRPRGRPRKTGVAASHQPTLSSCREPTQMIHPAAADTVMPATAGGT